MKGSYEVEKALLVQRLMRQEMTYDELVASSGLKKPTIAAWVKQMRAAKCVYVYDWAADKNGALRVPVFCWGNYEDAPRPGQRRTSAERMAALRAARKEGGV